MDLQGRNERPVSSIVDVLVALFLPLALTSPTAANAAVYVDGNPGITDPRTGQDWATAYSGIQQAIDDPRSEIEDIRVATGRYQEAIVLSSGRRLYGGFRGFNEDGDTVGNERSPDTMPSTIDGSTIRSGYPAPYVVTMDTVTSVTLDGFTITGGNANVSPSSSGGVYAANCVQPVVISDCRIVSNRGGHGGGIWCFSSSALITSCTFENNVAFWGGGGISLNECLGARIENCAFQGNAANAGGGLHATSSDLVVDACLFEGNTGSQAGGGVWLRSTTCTLQTCRITNNSDGDRGGGLHCEWNASVVADQCLIAGNYAPMGGGIFMQYGCRITMSHCMIVGNQSLFSGGGFQSFAQYQADNSEFNDCILSGNYCQGNGGSMELYQSNPIYNNTLLSGNLAHRGGGADLNFSSPQFLNCTISHNVAPLGSGLVCDENSDPLLLNTIVSHNGAFAIAERSLSSDPAIRYCLFDGNTPPSVSVYGGGQYSDAEIGLYTKFVAEADHNTSGPTRFVMESSDRIEGICRDFSTDGASSATLVDPTQQFTPGALTGLLINPDQRQSLQALIVGNTEHSITILGAKSLVQSPLAGSRYVVIDYHLRAGSQAIDAGTSLGVPLCDADGTPRGFDGFRSSSVARGDGSDFDIGPYEWTDWVPLPTNIVVY